MGDDKKPEGAAEQGGWMGWATRTAAVLAVLAALSSAQQGSSNLDAIIEQGKVNDMWALYQAKSAEYHTADSLHGLAQALGSEKPSPQMDEFLKKMKDEASKELGKKAKAQADAHECEAARDKCIQKGFWFEVAFALLQLGVILTTVALGAKRPSLMAASVVLGLFGFLFIVNAYVRVIAPPGFAKHLAPKLAAGSDTPSPSPSPESTPDAPGPGGG